MLPMLLSEPASKKRILANLHLAIDEAKLLRSLTMSKELAQDLKYHNPGSDRLKFVEKEIVYLETELVNVHRKEVFD
jgi:hypothetical protein